MPAPIDPVPGSTDKPPAALVTASSGWSHLMNVMSTTAPLHLAGARQSSRGLRALIRRTG